MILPPQRHLFEIPDDVTYLNCAYMSPLMTHVRRAAEAGFARKSRPWELTTADFFEPVNQLRSAFARLINATADDIALIPSASYGIATAAANVGLTQGQSVVVCDEQFPSHVYAWQARAAAIGGTIKTVARPSDDDWTSAVLATIDSSTAVVAIPQCHWTDGGWFDLPVIAARAREVGAAVVIDATQSAGASILDVAAIKPDFLVVAGYKWLMGPYSTGVMYVAPWRQQGSPIEHSWINRRGSEDFAALVNYRADFADGARRFDVGESSNFALVPGAVAGIEQILDWGVEVVAATIARLTTKITDHLGANEATAQIGFAPSAFRAGHFLGLRFPGGPPDELLARLKGQNISVSVRGSSIRVTPHVYNTDVDIERFLAALDH